MNKYYERLQDRRYFGSARVLVVLASLLYAVPLFLLEEIVKRRNG